MNEATNIRRTQGPNGLSQRKPAQPPKGQTQACKKHPPTTGSPSLPQTRYGPNYRNRQQWTTQSTNYPPTQGNQPQQRWQDQKQTPQNYQGRRQWSAQRPRPDTRRVPNFRGRTNPTPRFAGNHTNSPPRFTGNYRTQMRTGGDHNQEELVTRHDQDKPGQDVQPDLDSNTDAKSLQMLMTTMTSLQENMAKLLQRSNEPTNTPIPVYSPQTLGLPVSYPWQGNKSTPSPMVDPPNPVTTNHSGQNFQPMGQYSHPTWQHPPPRAWGQSPCGHL